MVDLVALDRVTRRHLFYVTRLDQRKLQDIDLVVMHCTELPDLATAREFGEVIHYSGSQTGNSGHFYIDRDGSVEEWVPPNRVAHHVRGLNTRSIGIELVNLGRYPDWHATGSQSQTEPFSDLQVEALIRLVTDLRDILPELVALAGHEDLDREEVPASDDPSQHVARKRDPGPGFPWEQVVDGTGLERWTSVPLESAQ